MSFKGVFMINVGSRSVRYLHGVPYPVVTFYRAMETFLRAIKSFKYGVKKLAAGLELTKINKTK